MMLNILRNDDLVYAGTKIYAIAKSDIIPGFILVQIRPMFGDFNWYDKYVPDYYALLGYPSRNFIICTGSV